MRIDFEDATLNQSWLNVFGENGLNIVCQTDAQLREKGEQPDITKINWGGAVFEQAWAAVSFDRKSKIYLTRLEIDIKTIKPMTGYFCSVVGASPMDDSFERSISDLREKLLKRVIGAEKVFFAPKDTGLIGNSECTPEYLQSKGYIAVNPNPLL